MAVPALKLDLAPPSTLWRLNHGIIGAAALAAGAILLASALAFTVKAYTQASRAGRLVVLRASQTRSTEEAQRKVLDELRSVDVSRELPKWRLAERILTERSLPWSRLTAELERTLVENVRLKSLQRTRGADMKVQVKIKGEARTRDAEATFMEELQKNPFFDQVILERESERQGGGVDFEYTLAAVTIPPAYNPLPKYSPKVKVTTAPGGRTPAQATPAKAAPAAQRPPARVPPRTPLIGAAPHPAMPSTRPAMPSTRPAMPSTRPAMPSTRLTAPTVPGSQGGMPANPAHGVAPLRSRPPLPGGGMRPSPGTQPPSRGPGNAPSDPSTGSTGGQE